jgi:hypothetical protein
MELEAVLRFARAADVANFGPGGICRLHRLDGAVAVELCEALRPQLDGHEAREQVRRLRRGP